MIQHGISYPYSGTFDQSGNAAVVIPRTALTPVTAYLHLDLYPVNGLITGSISNIAWMSPLHCELAPFATTNPATAYEGDFTLIIPPGAGAPAASPGGYGDATIIN